MNTMQTKEVSVLGKMVTLYSINGDEWNSSKDRAGEVKRKRVPAYMRRKKEISNQIAIEGVLGI